MVKQHTHSRILIKRIWREQIQQHRKQLSIATLCMLIAAASTAGMAYMLEPVMDDIFINQDQQLLLIIPAILFAIAVVKGMALYLQSVLMQRVGHTIVCRLQMALYQHLLRADVALHDANSSGRWVSRFTHDIYVVRTNLIAVLITLVRESLTLSFLVGLMVYQNWQLALIAFTVFPIAILPIMRLGHRMRKISRSTQEQMEQFTQQLDDTFQCVRVVKSYGGEQYEANKAKTLVDRLLHLFYKSVRVGNLASPIMEALSGIAIALVVWYGGQQVLTGETTPGALMSFIGAFLMAYRPAKSLSKVNTVMQDMLASLDRVFALLDHKPQVRELKNAKTLSVKNPSIRFENVSFAYDNTSKSALNDVSFTIEAGKKVALVGASGSGKTTVMSLIQRFYDTARGAVLVGNQDIAKVTLDSLRSHISVVNQQATLFDDTIRANIAYGMPDATDEQVIAAAQAAAAHDFIEGLEDGYDTQVGQQGGRLSGGQKQRVAIARAILHNAPILLLDEATSALDTKSERQVQEALNRLMAGRTTLMIAHRLSTIEHADQILVLQDGVIVESGSHDELLARRRIYWQLHQQQFAAER